MPGIVAVDALEVPRARDDFREVSTLTWRSATLSHPMGEGTRAWPRLQQEERFHIDLPAAENFAFLRQRIGADPHAVLQVAEAFVAQVAAPPFALLVWCEDDDRQG